VHVCVCARARARRYARVCVCVCMHERMRTQAGAIGIGRGSCLAAVVSCVCVCVRARARVKCMEKNRKKCCADNLCRSHGRCFVAPCCCCHLRDMTHAYCVPCLVQMCVTWLIHTGVLTQQCVRTTHLRVGHIGHFD